MMKVAIESHKRNGTVFRVGTDGRLLMLPHNIESPEVTPQFFLTFPGDELQRPVCWEITPDGFRYSKRHKGGYSYHKLQMAWDKKRLFKKCGETIASLMDGS